MAFRHQTIETEDLRARLRNGIVKFAFVKLDGTLREVQGTLNLNQVPASQHPTGTGNPSSRALRFFDFNAGGWRSLRIGAQLFILE
jgi:hypothetical protein